ncbi:MAG TPA: LysE family transporter [Telluria sp.]|nr:LysE family transporter [Telluria sp.]
MLSPGPSNLAIAQAAMEHGRARALALAAGVIAGSVTWGLLAALGLAALLQRYAAALVVVKLLGGAYLLWLAWKAAHAARAPAAFARSDPTGTPRRKRAMFVRGAALHLTNPKAILVWLSLVSLALPGGTTVRAAVTVVASCGLIGVAVFGGYALAFSTPAARRVYRAAHRWLNASLACVFAWAGARMLLSNSSR